MDKSISNQVTKDVQELQERVEGASENLDQMKNSLHDLTERFKEAVIKSGIMDSEEIEELLK